MLIYCYNIYQLKILDSKNMYILTCKKSQHFVRIYFLIQIIYNENIILNKFMEKK